MKFPDALIENISYAERSTPVAGDFITLESRPAEVLCVDGGSGVILSSPSHAVCIVRTYVTHWRQKKRVRAIKEEFLVHIQFKESVLVTEYKSHSKSYTIDFVAQAIPQDYIDQVRKRAEVLAAINYLDRFVFTGTVVLDGDLQAEDLLERQALDRLQIVAHETGAVVSALSKTNRFVSEGNTALVSDLLQQGPSGTWCFPLSDRTSFVKLHTLSKYAFRLDCADPLAASSALLELCADPVFLGYPYPLVEADSRARVSFKEVETLRLQLLKKTGKLSGMAALDAHGVLDALNN